MANNETKRIPFITNSPIFTPADIDLVLKNSVNSSMLLGNNKKEYFFNVPCSFDIETTSFYIDETGAPIDYATKVSRKELLPNYEPDKRAIMYIWQFGINGRVIIGRTWPEFIKMINRIAQILELNEKRRLIVYVHNLGYEFQFLSRWFNWAKVFASDERKPIYAITENGVEFRCSYILSGYGLAKLGGQLLKYKVEKKVGDLNYDLMRHCGTPLTEKEIGYCINDIRVVMAYIQEQIENEKGITNLPLTKTGYVRNHCKRECSYTPKTRHINTHYFDKIHGCNIRDLSEFNLLKRAFQGGFTHANADYSRKICEKVSSFDFTSSYPSVMITEKFPMASSIEIELKSREDYEEFILDKEDKYLSVFDIRFYNLMAKETCENPISASKCVFSKGIIANNGRVFCADELFTSITNIDFEYIQKFYTWDEISISNVHVYSKDYLPTELVKCILDLYKDKTELKGVEGMEFEYLKSKEMINSVYGMSVTNPLQDDITFNGVEWSKLEKKAEEILQKLDDYNASKNRFLFYAWGVFVTAYARRNLFTAILEFQDDYIYSDTDSIKVFNANKHEDYIRKYNLDIWEKLKKACAYHQKIFKKEKLHKQYFISLDMMKPTTKEGKIKILGVWDYEGTYDYFKTLGAKRYMIAKKDALKIDGTSYPISITISGVNKFEAVPYIFNELAGGDVLKCFEYFEEYLQIPAGKTGKMLHTYIDGEQSGKLVDYLGNEANYYEKSSIHLEPTSYDLSLAAEYVDFLKGKQTTQV